MSEDGKAKPSQLGHLAETVQLRGGFKCDRDGFGLSERSGEILDDLAGDHFGAGRLSRSSSDSSRSQVMSRLALLRPISLS